MNFKFGVIYAKAGQVTDNEMFSNGKLSNCKAWFTLDASRRDALPSVTSFIFALSHTQRAMTRHS